MNKKVFLVILIVITILVGIPLTKNIILYITYNHGNKVMTRVDGIMHQLKGTWFFVFDTYQCGLDENHQLVLTIDSDSTGRMKYEHRYERIDGYGTNVYSWRSLLPFDNSKKEESNYYVKMRDSYLICLNTDSLNDDTLFYHFKFANDSLFIGEYSPLYGPPIGWEMEFSKKDELVNIFSLSGLLSDWYSLYQEIITYL